MSSEPTSETDLWTLAIPEDIFDAIYGETVDKSIFKRLPESDEDLIRNFMPSKLWRMNNLYQIVDKDGERLGFRMTFSQHMVYAASLEHPRLIILKSRQQGISTFWLISFFDDSMMLENKNIGLMAQGEDEAATLLKRVKLAWDAFPEEIREFLGLKQTVDNNKELGYNNDSTIFIRVSFRSATLHRLHISEYGKISNENPKRAVETKTGTLQAIKVGNPVVIESTAEGDNDFKAMWDKAIESQEKVNRLNLPVYPGKDFKPVFLSWLQDPDCVSEVYEEETAAQTKYFAELEEKVGSVVTQEQRNFWISQFRELGERIFQEYPATPEEAFSKINAGNYYAKLYNLHVISKGRRIPKLYDPNIEVNVAMDLGMDDTFVLVYFQIWKQEYRVIEEYTNSGEGLEHYVGHMFDSGYDIDWVVAPHDIKVRDLSGGGKTRYDLLKGMGVKKIKVLDRLPIQDGIEAVRDIIPHLWIDEQCEYIHKCMKNYSKEWDDRKEMFKNQPLHDKYSHGSDAIRYMALSKLRGAVRTNVSNRSSRRAKSATVADGIAF